MIIPTRFSSSSTTGSPENPYLSFKARISPIVVFGLIITGSRTNPDSNRFTELTFAACSSIVIFRWITPIPPACAIAIAMRDSVTVSIAAEIIGMCREIDEVSLVFRSTSAGRTSDSAGSKSTSSKVSASGIESLAIRDTRERLYINDS